MRSQFRSKPTVSLGTSGDLQAKVEMGRLFLLHENTKNIPPRAKITFLRQKGLSNHDIEEAFGKAGLAFQSSWLKEASVSPGVTSPIQRSADNSERNSLLNQAATFLVSEATRNETKSSRFQFLLNKGYVFFLM